MKQAFANKNLDRCPALLIRFPCRRVAGSWLQLRLRYMQIVHSGASLAVKTFSVAGELVTLNESWGFVSPNHGHFIMAVTSFAPMVSPVGSSKGMMIGVGLASSAVTALLCLVALPVLNDAEPQRSSGAGRSTAPVSLVSVDGTGQATGITSHPRSSAAVHHIGSASSASVPLGPRGRGGIIAH